MNITGNRVLSGNYAEVWIDGELIAECNGITAASRKRLIQRCVNWRRVMWVENVLFGV